MTYQENVLAAKIKATNRANAHANNIEILLRQAFSAFVGKKVNKSDGSLTVAAKKALPDIEGDKLQVWFSFSAGQRLVWRVKTSEPVAGYEFVVYAEANAYIGKLDAYGVLTEVSSEPSRQRADYDLSTVLGLQAAARSAKQAYEDARSACYPFPEDDRY